MKNLKTYLDQYHQPKILDIGSGKGDFIQLIDQVYQDYSEIIGIDIVDYLLEMDVSAFENNPKIKWMDIDVLETTFPKNSFDVISLSNTLHHIKDISSIFEQMVAMLKPGGIIVVSELISTKDLTEPQMSHQLLHSFAAKVDHHLGRVHSQLFTEKNILSAIEKYASLPIVDHWQLDTKPYEAEITAETLIELVDQLLEKVKDSSKYDLYQKEALDLKDHLKNNDFSLAKQICVILKND